MQLDLVKWSLQYNTCRCTLSTEQKKMVFYFTSKMIDPPAMIYMGKDKFENEDLIKHGWDEDVWFHIDKLSSAHVYLRLPSGMTWDAIPEELLVDLAQLTKANSIEGNLLDKRISALILTCPSICIPGNKKDNVVVIYTPWSNLKKSPGMETGQVSFHKGNIVKRIHVEKRINEIINRLNKTREETYPDLADEKIKHLKEVRKQARSAEQESVIEPPLYFHSVVMYQRF